MIEIKNAFFGFAHPLVEVDFCSLEPGQIYGLIGANGKGKSTLVKTIIGEVALLSGEILLNEEPISRFDKAANSKLFSHVSSKFAGIAHLKVLEYVLLGRTPYLGRFGQATASDNEIALQALSSLDIQHLAEKFSEEISDGERQMVAIARALAQETPYIFLDEPTAFLDYLNKRKIMSILKSFVEKNNKCILVISHDLEVLLQYTDCLFCIPEQSKKLQIIQKNEYNLEEIIERTFQ